MLKVIKKVDYSEGEKQDAHIYMSNKEHTEHFNGLDFKLPTDIIYSEIDLDSVFKRSSNLREPDCILDYIVLVSIEVQSDKPNEFGITKLHKFDSNLSIGVSKTFITKYIDLLDDKYDVDSKKLDELKGALKCYLNKHKTIINEEGLNYVKTMTIGTLPTLVIDAPFFKSIVFDSVWGKAVEKTNRKTYQAMEVFINNLNIIYSKYGSKDHVIGINYGTATSEEGRMVTDNLLLALASI